MNTLYLQSNLHRFENDDSVYFVTMILVDGKTIVDFSYYATSLIELKKSMVKDGEYFILTCWCGVPECAGIERGIKVTHHQDTVTWTMIQPQRQKFIFSVDNYQTVIVEGIKQIEQDLAMQIDREDKLDIVPYQEE